MRVMDYDRESGKYYGRVAECMVIGRCEVNVDHRVALERVISVKGGYPDAHWRE